MSWGWQRVGKAAQDPAPAPALEMGSSATPASHWASYPGKNFPTASTHHHFQAGFQLVMKTKDALYVSGCFCQDK